MNQKLLEPNLLHLLQTSSLSQGQRFDSQPFMVDRGIVMPDILHTDRVDTMSGLRKNQTCTDVEGTIHKLPSDMLLAINQELYANHGKSCKACTRCGFPCSMRARKCADSERCAYVMLKPMTYTPKNQVTTLVFCCTCELNPSLCTGCCRSQAQSVEFIHASRNRSNSPQEIEAKRTCR